MAGETGEGEEPRYILMSPSSLIAGNTRAS
jgi:hypothetical protein